MSRKAGRKAERQAGRPADRKAEIKANIKDIGRQEDGQFCRTENFVGLRIRCRPPSCFSSRTPLAMTLLRPQHNSISCLQVGRGSDAVLKAFC